MDAGKVDLLVILGGNPVYTAPADLKFAERSDEGPPRPSTTVSTTTRRPISVTGTFPTRTRSRRGATRARTTAPSRSSSRSSRRSTKDGRRTRSLSTLARRSPDRSQLDIVKDYWTRAFAGRAGASATPRASRSPTPMQFWQHALHDGFIRGTSIADGGPATPFVPAPAAAPATLAIAGASAATGAPPAAAPAAPAEPAPAAAPSAPEASPAGASPAPAAGLEIIFRPDPTVWDGRFANNGWLQELPKPLTKVTWDATAWISPSARRRAQPATTATSIELQLSRQHRADADLPRRRPPAASRSRSSSATAAAGGPRRQRGKAWRSVQRVPAPHVRRALVRHRPRDLEDRRPAPARDDPGPPPDGRPRPGARRHARGIPARAEDHRGDGREAARDADAVSRLQVRRLQVGHGDRPQRLHRLQRLHRSPARPRTTSRSSARSRSRAAARCTGSASTATSRATSTTPRSSLPPAGAVHAVRERAVRARLPGRRDDAQPRRPERHGLQPLRRHALLLEQLPVQGPPLQLPALLRTGTRRACSRCATRTSRCAAAASWRSAPTACSASTRRASTPKREDREIRDGEIVTACQQACPTDAIVFGDLNDPEQPGRRSSRPSSATTACSTSSNTRPRTTYLGGAAKPEPGARAEAAHRRLDTDRHAARRRAAAGHRAGTHVRYGHREDRRRSS